MNSVFFSFENNFKNISLDSVSKILSTEDRISSNGRFSWDYRIEDDKVIVELKAEDISSLRAGVNAITNIFALIDRGDKFE